MHLIAPNLYQFRFLWRNLFNAYYIAHGDESVVVDASTRWDRRRMLKQLRGKPVALVALAHAHPDHQGSAKKICETFGAPLACHQLDVESADGRAPLVRQNPLLEIIGNSIWAGPRSRVGRVLNEGDTIAGFTVYHLPGHTPGHIVLLRESDRVAIVGDVLNNNNNITHFPHLHEPPWIYSHNPMQNRDSIRRLQSLRPSLMVFGHGPPLRDMTKLDRYLKKIT